MITVEFEYEIQSKILIKETMIEGTVVAYFVGSLGVQYMVDYFNRNGTKFTTYLHPAQIKAISEDSN